MVNKKQIYLTIGIAGFILGCIGALTSLKLFLGALIILAGILLLLLDYEKLTYVVALYPLLYFVIKIFAGGTILENAWDELLFVFCIFVWFYKWLVFRKDRPYKWTPMEFPIIAFFALSFFLLFVRSPDRIGIDGLRAVIQYMIFFFVVVQFLRSKLGMKHLVYILVLVGTYMGLDGIRQYILNVEMPSNWVDKAEGGIRTRVFSVAGNPNALAAMMIMTIPLTVSLVFTEKKLLKKALFSAATVAMTLCLFFTGSRSAWIGLMVAGLIYAFLNKDKRIIIGLLLGAALVYVAVPSVQQRIGYLISPDYINSSMKDGRLTRWPKAIELFQQNFWLGVGFGRFGGAVAAANKVPGSFYIDNYYLKIAVEMGVLGITAFMLLMYNIIAWGLRSIRKLRGTPSADMVLGALSGACGVMITNIFLNNFDAPMVATYFWMLAGLCVYPGFASDSNTEPAAKDVERIEAVEA